MGGTSCRTLGRAGLVGIMALVELWPLITMELDAARRARAARNEGKARVCARRAAGLAAHEYYDRKGRALRTSSAYDLLNMLAVEPALPSDLREIALHLTLRVDGEFKLPDDIDLIVEAQRLCDRLLNA